MESGLILQGDGQQDQGGSRAPEACGRAGLLSFIRRGPMAETQVLASTLQTAQGLALGVKFYHIVLDMSCQFMAASPLTVLDFTPQDMFSGQQDGLEAVSPSCSTGQLLAQCCMCLAVPRPNLAEVRKASAVPTCSAVPNAL